MVLVFNNRNKTRGGILSNLINYWTAVGISLSDIGNYKNNIAILVNYLVICFSKSYFRPRFMPRYETNNVCLKPKSVVTKLHKTFNQDQCKNLFTKLLRCRGKIQLCNEEAGYIPFLQRYRSVLVWKMVACIFPVHCLLSL